VTERVMDTRALPEVLLELITTEQVRVKEVGEMIQLVPVKEAADCTIGLRGILADCPEMSVDKFLERMRTDAELDL